MEEQQQYIQHFPQAIPMRPTRKHVPPLDPKFYTVRKVAKMPSSDGSTTTVVQARLNES